MFGYLIQNSFDFSLLFFVIGAFGSLVFAKNKNFSNSIAYSAAAIASAFGIIAALSVIFSHNSLVFSLPQFVPYLDIKFLVDDLAAYFILIISIGTLAASIYAIDYAKEYFGKYNIGILGFLYNIFALSLILVVSAANVFWFLIVWEIMSVSSYFLVIYEYDKEESQKAGFLYLVMTHIGAAFIALALLILNKYAGSLDFSAFGAAGASLPVMIKSSVFLLAFIGFGSKAGIVPLHVWLPSAHPAAPSHVSALMSGVMLKVAIYGLIRVIFSFLGAPELWWGILVISIAAISAILGILYALTEHDLKRLLAFSSVENIGIILIGVGGAMVFLSLGFPSLAAVALVGGLLHAFNHSLFKGLLFLGVGSVIKSAHTRNMEKLGGLIRLMPVTAALFLVGAISISAIPPFNGFVSEWIIFQSLFANIFTASLALKILFTAIIAILAMTSALAAACFVKAFGITFLAKPRSEQAEKAREVPRTMTLGMGLLAALCAAFGVYPYPLLSVLGGISRGLIPLSAAFPSDQKFFITPFQNGFSSFSPLWVLVLVGGAILLAYCLEKFLGGKKQTRFYNTWDCGGTLNPRMQYTATAFSKPIQMIFKNIYRPFEKTEVNYYNDDVKYFPKEMKYESEIIEVYDKYLYSPVIKTILRTSEKFNWIQFGNVNMYLLYIFLALIILLLFFK